MPAKATRRNEELIFVVEVGNGCHPLRKFLLEVARIQPEQQLMKGQECLDNLFFHQSRIVIS